MTQHPSHFNDPTRRFFFLCGTTHDEFWTADLRHLTLEQLLLRHLQTQGYRRIVFVDPAARLCFWDRRSYTLCLPPERRAASPNTTHTNSASNLIPAGPLGRGPLLARRRATTPPGPDAGPPPPATEDMSPALLSERLSPYGAMRDSQVAARMYDLLLTPRQPETAIVFTDTLNMLAHFGQEEPAALGHLTHAFDRLAMAHADNRNICCFIFQNRSPGAVSEQFEQNASWCRLRDFLLTRNEPSKATITLGAPRQDEIACIIHYFRLRHHAPVEWDTLPGIIERLARHWRCHHRLGKELHLNIQGFVSASRPLNAQTLGSLIQQNPKGTALERLRAMKGMDPVIQQVERWLQEYGEKIAERRKQLESAPAVQQAPAGSFTERILPQPDDNLGMNLHLVLKGRPGTGKTTVARLIAEVFAENGILPSGHLVEVKRDDLVAGYVGQTAIKTMERIEESMGGMLFIDEAYELRPKGENDFGGEAIATLLKVMEDRKGRFSVVLAGYPGPMDELLQANEGFRRRLGENVIEIPPYDAETLRVIFEQIAADANRTLSPELQEALPGFFKNWWRANHRIREFGFAGDVKDKLLAGFHACRRARVAALPQDDPARREFTLVDVPEAYRQYLPGERQDDLNSLLAELDAMEGLETVKQKIRQIIARRQYAKTHKPDSPLNPGHYVFSGSPGTGKTTVAWLMGRMLAALELLDRAEVLDTNSGEILQAHNPVAFLRERFEAALGGVLFIDEAYGLAPAAEGDGRQIIMDTLTPLLDKHAHEISVVMAGYTAPMSRLLESNAGLTRRFPMNNRLEFNDFTPEQLVRIFRKQAEKNGFAVPETLDPALRAFFQQRKAEQKSDFGNAGEVNNVFMEMEGHFATRAQSASDIEHAFILQDVPSRQRRPIREDDLRQALERLERLTGLTSVKQAVREWVNQVRTAARRGDDAVIAPGHFAFVGNPGTGKTTVARLLGDIMRALGLLSNGKVHEVKREDLVVGYQGQTAPKTRQECNQGLDNVLFLDEAYSLVQGDGDSFGKEALDTLLHFVEDNRQRMSFVIAGYPDDIRQFIEHNPGMRRRVPNTLVFENYKPEELVEIFTNMAAEKRFTLTDAATEKVFRLFDRMVREADRNFGNAGEARNLLEAAIRRQSSRLSAMKDLTDSDPRDFIIEPDDLVEMDHRAERAKTYEEVRARLDAFIGLGSVKKAVDDLRQRFELRRRQGDRGREELTPGHYAFIGNPGTGKTEIAKLFGELLYGIGLLKRGHTVTVSRADLVSNHVGDTAIKTNTRIDEALDGVLFIDEAYSLVQSDEDAFGKEALDVLIARMENNRRRLSVIMAGYTTEMRQFIEKNSGLQSRITREIPFPDYTADELARIFVKMAHDGGYELGDGAEARLRAQCASLLRGANAQFGNARVVREQLKAATERMSARLLEVLDEIPEGDPRLFRIEAADIAEPEQDIRLEDALAPLDRLVGLHTLKQQIRNWATQMQAERWKGDDAQPPAPGHYLFVGNPGTGKTTVARMMGRILKALGCLRRGHVEEVKRAELVAGYVGQTAIKTRERLKDAVGGVLFLDEAYSLVKGNQDSFGEEALDTLLAFMEDHRENLCVIFAGYPEPIAELVKTNPGLTSRFSSTFVFENYSPADMVEIFRVMAAEQKLTLDEGVPEGLLPIFEAWVAVNDPHFGNAREVRKLFETARQNIAVRVMHATGGQRPDDLSVLSRITAADIPALPAPSQDPASTARSSPARIARRSLPREYPEEGPSAAVAGARYATAAARRVAPCVMFIEVRQTSGQKGSGTAFLITPDGLALTCHHVTQGAQSMRVRFEELPGQWFEAGMVAADAQADLALIRVKDAPRHAVVLADPEIPAALGDGIGLLGYMLGEELGPEITYTDGAINSTRQPRGVRHYQISSGAGPGNSGGPLFRLSDGQVIGVLSGGVERTANAAINLAVDIREFYDRLTVAEPETQAQAQAKESQSAARPATTSNRNQ